MSWPPSLTLLLSLGLALMSLRSTVAQEPPEGALAVPAGFTDALLADNVGGPTALAFTGSMLNLV